MKTITIISGKGGTGKTSITASLAYLFEKSILIDADVDASDLAIVVPELKLIKEQEFEGEKKAVIDKSGCISCHRCIDVCEFSAISEDYVVNPYFCEGCGACFLVCPTDTIKWKQDKGGKLYHYNSKYGHLFTANLYPGNGNAGDIVYMLRRDAEEFIKKENLNINQTLIDGPPGSGCPVISSITGVDMVIAITEPTLSGISDLKKVLDVSKHFNIPSYIVINKYDLNENNTKELENFAKLNNYSVIAKIPYDKVFVQAELNRLPVIKMNSERINKEIYKIFNFIKDNLKL